MAVDHALRGELSHRIREDLVRLGIVADGPAARIAGGAQAGPGDLIICTRNDHTVQAGETSGTWTGLACPAHGLSLGADIDLDLATRGDLSWPRTVARTPPP